MILWKSVLEHRDYDRSIGSDVILADRSVLFFEDLALGYRHENCWLSDRRWSGTYPYWSLGVRFDVLRFGYYSDFYDCEHHVLSFGPFYVYWSR